MLSLYTVRKEGRRERQYHREQIAKKNEELKEIAEEWEDIK